jgi:6-pyruvoyltetrahydropterin/6-carboxytetrahydropterin synthase
MLFTIRKKYRIEMAHQLASAVTAACHETIHGHSYVVEVFISSESLNKDGMVLDFGALNEVKNVIFEYDHALCLPRTIEPAYREAIEKYNIKCIFFSQNPTAEVLAQELLFRLSRLVAYPCRISKVRVHETETGYAEAEVR